MNAAAKQRELDNANADLAWWESTFKPLGYTVHGWTYRTHASVVSPTGAYVQVDQKILELIDAARAAGK